MCDGISQMLSTEDNYWEVWLKNGLIWYSTDIKIWDFNEESSLNIP